MVTRAIPIEGLYLNTPGAKRVAMSALDKAIAAIPGLVFDLDPSRLVSPGLGFFGQDRKNGAKLTKNGTVSIVPNASTLNGRTALRMVGGAPGHQTSLMRGLSSKSFSLIYMGTLAALIRNTPGDTSRGFFSIYDGATLIVWARYIATTGALAFSTTPTINAANLALSTLPAADVPAIFCLSRNDAASSGQMNINIDGVSRATATDATSPNVSVDKKINLGSVDALSPTRAFAGDGFRWLAYDVNVPLAYPLLFAELIQAAKAELGIIG